MFKLGPSNMRAAVMTKCVLAHRRAFFFPQRTMLFDLPRTDTCILKHAYQFCVNDHIDSLKLFWSQDL